MIDSIKNIFAIPDLRKRLFYTFALLAVYRVGAHIPTPGVDSTALGPSSGSRPGASSAWSISSRGGTSAA